jgi:sugar lactone lactonase YvrE
MNSILTYIAFLLFASSCGQSTATVDTTSKDTVVERVLSADTVVIPQTKTYSELSYLKKEVLAAAPGTKSVLFNSSGTLLYAMNLEGMSVYEFDQSTRKITREFKFKPTRGMGWDYNKSRPIQSYQEKPVEACFSHGDEILWISLHNAEGIIPIWVKDISKNDTSGLAGQSAKPVTVHYPGTSKKDSFNVPLIITGKTPKVIAKTADDKFLMVSNWHSRTVSVLELDPVNYPYGKVIRDIPVSAIPRGIAVDDKNRKTFVAIMGGSTLAVLNNEEWKTDTIVNVWSSPRHVVMDTSGHLFVSYNSIGMVACIDAATNKTLFSISTHSQPRTICLSKNHKFLFVTCYTSDMVDVYKINADSFTKVASLPCAGHPVGVDIFENDNILEAWVCAYSSGSINVYTFKKL